ncbi:LysR family transcriptional regulator [Litoribacillus peritrichatus]|uniref:LysR family transcriptional regulator n=1 Tax=Litoribacillus peritrichatus TaxID=718191 RepID=A0ABP7M9L5_9GAMM
MELSDLAVFQAVVEAGGVSRAAEMLHRVPSNITSRIQKLETELGKQLFIREKNRLRISPEGEQLLGYAVKILALADEAVEQLNLDHPTGRLRVGSMEALAASRLSSVLTDYHTDFPDVELELKTNPTGLLIDQVISGELDLALVADPPKDARLEITPIFSERLVLVSSRNQAPVSSPQDLSDNPTLLGFSTRCAYRNRLADWVQSFDVAPKVVEINSYHALLNCVTAGMGVGIVPEVLLVHYPFKDGIRTHPLPDSIADTTTCVIWRKDSAKPSLLKFYHCLLGHSNLAPR